MLGAGGDRESLQTKTGPDICGRRWGEESAWEGSFSGFRLVSESVSQAHGTGLGQSHLPRAPHPVETAGTDTALPPTACSVPAGGTWEGMHTGGVRQLCSPQQFPLKETCRGHFHDHQIQPRPASHCRLSHIVKS